MRRANAIGAAVPISLFVSHVTAMHQNGGFKREFEALQEWEQRRKAVIEDAAEAAGNSPKKNGSSGVNGENRYANVIACTRVQSN